MNRKKGFTLVELLVVISIIALLMSILMPALARVRLQAKDAMCKTNLSQWGKVLAMYTMDHNGYFFDMMCPNGYDPPTPGAHFFAEHCLRYYNENFKLMSCPMANKSKEEGGKMYTPFVAYDSDVGIFTGYDLLHIEQKLFSSVHSPTIVKGSYGMNLWFRNLPYNQICGAAIPNPVYCDTYMENVWWRSLSIKNSAAVIWLRQTNAYCC